MYLKSLVMQGFKSFANRVELTFLPGVSAVVGPNGSGKSNIADAIRWVLGEQSLRLLRGVRLPDVIFSGSDARRPLGMAEVAMTLDNSSGRLPLDFAEVTVTRRIFRSGESQFFLNKTPCRLRDIQDLFLDSGIGRGSLSLIGQGEVDAVLSASPADRRLLLEDAAGVARYRARKEEALEKLAETAADLLRVNDVFAEVTSQLEPMRQAAALARQHAALSEELRDLEAQLHGHEWARLDKQRREELARHEAATAEVNELNAGLERTEQEESRTRHDLAAVEALLDRARDELQQAREQEQRLQHASELLQERKAQLVRELERSRGMVEAAAQKGEEAKEQLAAAEAAWGKCAAAHEGAAQELQRCQAECAAAEEELRRVVQNLETARGELAAAERAAALWEGELRSSEGESGHAESHKQRLAEQRAGYEAQRAQVAQEGSRLQEALQEVEQRLEATRQAVTKCDEARRDLAAKQQELEKALALHARRYHELDSRRRVLADMASSYEGYFQGVRSVLAARDTFGPGVLGSVGDLIRVPAELDLAIETALGGALQNIVTRTDAEAEAAIAYLKRTKGGRATFLPLASLRYQVFSAADRRLLNHPEVVGVGSDLVSCAPEVRPAVEYLLGRTVVTRTLHGALQLSRRLTGFQRIVSLEGDLVSPGGAITGGSAATGRSSGILARNRELETLQEQLERLAGEGSQRERELAEAKAAAASRQAEREQLAEEIHRLELAKAATTRDYLAKQRECERLTALCNQLTEDERLAMAHDRTVAERLAAAREQLAAASESQARLATETERLETIVAQLNQKCSSLQGAVTQAKVAFAEAQERREAAGRDVTRLRAAVAEAAQLLANEQQAMQTAGAALERLEAELAANAAAIAQAEKAAVTALKKADEVRARVEALRTTVAGHEAQAKELRQKREVALERVHKAEMALTRIEAAIAAIEERLAELGATLPAAAEQLDAAAARRRVQELKEQIASLGPVNPGAISACEELEARHQFLSSQRDDLIAAKEQLEETIAEIDQTSGRRLRETYTKVQEAFARTFQRLFGGGAANLVWTDEENVLEAGLDLFVQPPGKRMQNMMALSGGERALTAIALLFAILAVRPSPFCVLDEIDAALDEGNVSRFAALLNDYARETQFIVITHRQATMEAADVLYGVTMDRTAVSSLISLRMADLPPGAAKAANQF